MLIYVVAVLFDTFIFSYQNCVALLFIVVNCRVNSLTKIKRATVLAIWRVDRCVSATW